MLARETPAPLVDQLLCPLEVILVDDGSADRSYADLRSWALEDPTVRLEIQTIVEDGWRWHRRLRAA